jgi:uncharacterized protein (TIGR02266 family)
MSLEQSAERRKTKRIRHRVVARAITLREEFNGVISNFSEIGLLVQIPRALRPGNILSLRAGMTTAIDLDGKVIWSRESANRGIWNTGIAIPSPSPDWLSLVYKLKSGQQDSKRGADERFEVQHNVRIDQAASPESRTENLSLGGMYLTTTMPLETGSTLQARIEIPGLPEPLRVTGRVVYRLTSDEAVAKGRQPGVGIQFEDMESDSKALLQNYLRGLSVPR